MKISFIGSGNVATHLAVAFCAAGAGIHQVWSRNAEHAAALAGRVGAEARTLEALEGCPVTSDVYILAVSDDALYELAPHLHLGDALVLHTSGATSLQLLQGVSSRYGVLWPPYSFVRDVAVDYGSLPFCIEGNSAATESDIRSLAQMITEHIYTADTAQRNALHLAAVFANNFVNGLYGIAQQVCRDHEVPFEILYPIILATAQRSQWGDVRGQITGPAVRRDEKTLARQLQMLSHSPESQEVYRMMTRLIQQL